MEETSEVLHLGMVAETWTHRKGNEKYLESFEMWYSRRMEMVV